MNRLEKAIQDLPLPAAFREGAITLRSIIRQKRKESQDYSDELSKLYWFAAIHSFYIPYSERLKMPGFNVVSAVPRDILLNLNYDYQTLGYESLSLLKSTDKKWIVESWGEPKRHSTLHAIHNQLWREHEEKIAKEMANRSSEISQLIRELNEQGIQLSIEVTSSRREPKRKKR